MAYSDISVGNHLAAAGYTIGSREEFGTFLEETLKKSSVLEKTDSWFIRSTRLKDFLNFYVVTDLAEDGGTAFPALNLEAGNKRRYPLTIYEIDEVEAADGLEGVLLCEYEGVAISVFDVLYAKNRGKYEIGETYDFYLGGLPYKVETGDRARKEGSVVGPGFSALMPAFKGDDSRKPEFVILGPVRDVKPLENGAVVYDVLTCRPDGDEMEFRLDIFTEADRIVSDKPVTGSDIFASVWLQGQLVQD